MLRTLGFPRLTRTDIIRLVSAVVLALLLWGWVTASRDPEVIRTFNNIPVADATLGGVLRVVGKLQPVTVRLIGARSDVNAVNQSDLQPRLALDQVDQPGQYTVRVEMERPPGVRRQQFVPAEVPIVVEETTSRQFELTIVKPNAEDSPLQVGDVSPDVSEVTLDGTSSLVERVAEVQLRIEIDFQTEDFTGQFTPIAVDEAGVPISEVTIRPETVRARVMIDTRGKSVVVLPQVLGEPAEGFEVVQRAVNPPTVVVDGPTEVLVGLISLTTGPVDISGANATVAARVPLQTLPEGVRLIQPAQAAVDVVVEIRQRGVMLAVPSAGVVVTGLAPGLTASASPDRVNVTVVASDDVLTNVLPDDIHLSIDATGLGPGIYQLRPTVALPSNVQWIQTDPALIQLTIASGAPSPVASPPT